jgi:hypothetical protein
MELFGDLVKMLLPAALVLYAMYLTVKSILGKEVEKKWLDHKTESTKIVLPLRLQAYERMCLFLERISPHNLLVRLNDGAMNAKTFQQVLVSEIREEFQHNFSQQIYISESAWTMVRHCVDEIIAIINTSSEKLEAEARGVDLAREVFGELERRGGDPAQRTLSALKVEIRELF